MLVVQPTMLGVYDSRSPPATFVWQVTCYQGHIEPPKAARGHTTFTDCEMLNIEFKF